MSKRKGPGVGNVPPVSPPRLDFRSRAFNRIDELQDCVGNYRFFEPLDGMVTADMRHRLERERVGSPGGDTAAGPPPCEGSGARDQDAGWPDEAPAGSRFALVLSSRCLRGRSRGSDCTRCLEACTFAAIETANRGVALDPVLCRGCGVCALVCPVDAIRTVFPSSEEVIARLRRALESSPPRAGLPPELTIREADAPGLDRDVVAVPGADARPGAGHVVFGLEHIGLVRVETLLAAFLYGAGSVVVVCPETTPRIAEAVRRQTDLAAAVLRGLGLPQEMVRCVTAPPSARREERAGFSALQGPALTGASTPPVGPPEDASILVRAAAQGLYERSRAQHPALPLPEGAPFGALEVAAGRCTSCLACAGACPTGALAAPGDAPRLEFRESRCHQCGLCVETCPEGALRLVPRLLCDPQAVERPAVLHDGEVARCLACGSPFAPRAMVERMRERLKGHWMYAEERQARRLELCGTCRARDAFVSEDVRRWAR